MSTTTMNTIDDPTVSTLGEGTKISHRTRSSRKKKPRATEEEIAAVRHMRLVVQSVTLDKTLSENNKKERIKTFDKMTDNVEKRLHYNPNRAALLDAPPEIRGSGRRNKRVGARASAKGGAKKSEKRSSFFGKHFKRASQSEKTAVVQEALDDARGEVNCERAGEEQEREDEIREQAEEPVEERRENSDDDDAKSKGPPEEEDDSAEAYEEDDVTQTDSIIDARMANSEDYTASICSVRSISTFEKDFIKNVIAEQDMQMDVISVSTFEQDFAARQGALANTNAHPAQVVVTNDDGTKDDNDELTIDDRSETTFEKDLRVKQQGAIKVELPTQLMFSNQPQYDNDELTIGDARSETTFEQDAAAREREENDNWTVGNLSETTFEKDAAAKENTSRANIVLPGNIAVGGDSDDCSVSTIDKDEAAKKRLAQKIGREPKTRQKGSADAPSTSKFENDTRIKSPRHRSDGSHISQNRFEKDTRKKMSDPKTGNDELLGFERDVSRNKGRSPMPQVVAAPQHIPLSPYAVDRGVKRGKKKMFGKFFSTKGHI